MVMLDNAVLDEVARTGRGEHFEPRHFVWTGSDLSRVELADGRAFVLKHLHAEGDWVSRLSNGIGRAQLVWRSGLLTQLDPVVEHGIVGIVEIDGIEALVMHDLSGRLNAPDCLLSVQKTEALMGALARFHDFAVSLDLPDLCSIHDVANLTNPALLRADRGRGHFEAGGDAVQQGLDYLVAKVGGAAADALAAFFDDVPGFASTVAERMSRPWLSHGDPRAENLGVADGRLVAVDWGELTGVAPREFDVAGFTVQAVCVHTEATPDQIRAAYERHASEPLDDELMRLAWLKHMTGAGVGNVGELAATSDPEERQRARARVSTTVAAFRDQF